MSKVAQIINSHNIKEYGYPGGANMDGARKIFEDF